MSIQQKILQYQGLTDYETHIVDSLPTSKYFKVFSLEDTIPGGRSTFQILGSEFLENGVELKIELLDVNGIPIYTEPIKYLGDDPSRHIMIEVYPTTAIGVGRLTILGSIVDVPEEWKGLYNVKWEKDVFIDPVSKNTQPILFRGQGFDVSRNQRYPLPEIEISETVTGVVVASGSGGNAFVTSSIFEGGSYDGNASPFARPMHIGDLINARTQESLIDSPPRNMGHAGIGGGQTAKTSYAAKSKNQQNTSDTTAIESNVVEQKYEEFHKPQAEPSPPPTPQIPPIASKPIPTPPPPVETKSKQADAVGKGTLIKRKSGEPFRLELAGGTFKSTPVVSDLVEGIKGREFESSSFTASIVAVHSPDLIEIDTPFVVEDKTPEKDDDPFIPVPHTGSDYTIDFEPVTTGSASEVILQSFANITIKNIKTFSGDVHRVKVFAKGFSTQGDFRLVSDKIVEGTDILINTGSVSLTQKTGKFIDQQHIDNNWQVKHIKRGTNTVGVVDTQGTATFTSSVHPPLMNAVLVSGSNTLADESILFETTTPKIKLRPNVDYTLYVNAILKTAGTDVLQDDGSILNNQSKAKVRFYISGSNLGQDLKGVKPASSGSVGNILGDPIKVITGEDEPQGEVIELKTKGNEIGKTVDFGRVKIPFKPQFSGSGITINDDTKLQVEVEAGELFIQSIGIEPSSDTNFNPDEFTFQVPMPKLRKRPDFFDFLVEFYDRDGNKAGYTTIKEAVEFDGENDVIQGTDNLLTGSLSIGNALGVGIEAAGVNSAYIRSVDYAGFDSSSVSGQGGFLMFSGSVSRSLKTSESYDGVGIELHDGNSGSFKFRTQNADGVGEFDVRTNKFFFGKTGVQFISGSDDKIEISSSNFHLQPDGNLTIGGGAKISASLSANQILVPANASTTAEASASITAAGAAKFVSASIGGFNVSEGAISSSNGELVLKSSGQITGSNFLLEGGKITSDVTIEGSFAANSLSLPAVGTPTAVVTAQGEATFSKAEIGSFKIGNQEIRSLSGSLILSASGAITASDVLITGTLNATAGTVSTSLGSLGHLSESLELFTGSIVTDLTSSISKSIEITREEVAKATASYGAGTSSFDTRFDKVGENTASLKLRNDKLELKTGSIDDVFAEVSHSFGLATSSLKTIVTESFELNSSSVDFASSGSQIKSLVFSSESIVRADASASIVSESVVIKSLLFSSESITRADVSSSLVLASASAEFEASASLISDKVDFASSGSQIKSLLFSSESIVRADASASLVSASSVIAANQFTNAGLSPIRTDFTQSRFEVTTLQSQATQSIGELGTLQSSTTQSLNASSSLSLASQSFVAEFVSSASLISDKVDFAATGSQAKILDAASNTQTSASNDATTKSDFAATGSQVKVLEAVNNTQTSASNDATTKSDFASSGSQTKATEEFVTSASLLKTNFASATASALTFAINANLSASANTASLLTSSSSLSLASQSIVAEFSDSASLLKENFSSVSQSALTFAINANLSASANTASLLTASSSFSLSSASLSEASTSFSLSSASLSEASTSLSDASASAALASASLAVQVSLEDDGVELYNSSATLLAKYGSKTELFAGGNTAHKAILDTSGLALVESNVTSAFFGATTTIGPEANNKSRVEIGSGAVKIINQDGSGNSSTVLNFDSTGDVTSDNFLLERTRLFGAGGDGVITLKHNTATVATGSNSTGAGKADSSSVIVNEQGTRVLTRTGSVWSLEGDLYADSLEVDNSTGTAPTLVTSGSRIFVKNEFKIDASCVVHNNAQAGDDGADRSTSDNSGGSNSPTLAGAGGKGNTLSAGTTGGAGGRGGEPDTSDGGSYYGGNGGGAGGSGGIIFISARFLVNSGSIQANGGDGGDGGNGKGELTGNVAQAGGAGAAGSLINIKV